MESTDRLKKVSTETSSAISHSIPGGGPHTILPATPLPEITDPVVIDGTSEPDYVDTPVVLIDGVAPTAAVGAGLSVQQVPDGDIVDGLRLTSGNSVVADQGLHRFSSDALRLTGSATSSATTFPSAASAGQPL